LPAHENEFRIGCQACVIKLSRRLIRRVHRKGSHPPVTFITDFADQAVILPLVFAIGVTLLVQGWWRGAAAWVLVVFATFAAILALKLVFIGCSESLGTPGIQSPSGHVAGATVVTGGLATLLLRKRNAALPLAFLAAIVIGISRLALGLHSVPEVIIGASVGLAGAYCLRVAAGEPPRWVGAGRIAAISIVVVLIFHGLHLPAEAQIRGTALRLARMLAVCQPDIGRL